MVGRVGDDTIGEPNPSLLLLPLPIPLVVVVDDDVNGDCVDA